MNVIHRYMVKSGQLNFRIEPEMKELLEAAAAAQDRSISSYVLIAVREKLEREGFYKSGAKKVQRK